MHKLFIGSQNTWSGCCTSEESPDHVIDYLCTHAHRLGVFALQEVHESATAHAKRFVTMRLPGHRPGPIDVTLGNRLRQRLQKTHRMFHHSHFTDAYHDYEKAPEGAGTSYGNMLLVNRGVGIIKPTTGHVIYGNFNLNTEKGAEKSCAGRPAARTVQIITIWHQNTAVTIANVHGLHSRKGKGDIPARMAQTAALSHAVRLHQLSMNPKPPVILIGDFNYISKQEALTSLLERTEAFGEDVGVNLNTLYNVSDTRTLWYPGTKPHREASFTFISNSLVKHIRDYLVITESVPSDHARIEVML